MSVSPLKRLVWALALAAPLAAATDPGDEILVEQPTYELLLSTAQYLGLKMKRFQRARYLAVLTAAVSASRRGT